jgi:hypothetical protein
MKKKLFFVAAILGISLAVLGLSLLSNQGAAIAAEMDGDDEAVIIVQKSATSSQSGYKISFTAPITGLAALQETGLVIVTKDYGEMGIAVCSIDGVGCPADDCFCDPDGKSWSYFHWEDDQWEASAVGPSSYELDDGAVDGWYWGVWDDKPSTTTNYYFSAYSALDWLATQQSDEDGGYGSASSSIESMFSIGSANIRSGDWKRSTDAPSLLGYMLGKGTAYSKDGAAEAGKLIAALVSSQGCLPFGTMSPMDYYDTETGKYADGAGFHTWGMIGSIAMSETVPVSATNYLKTLQLSSGGWEWVEGGFGNGEDTNTTSLAIQALIAVGEANDSDAILNGLAWLKSTQNDDGGFPYDPDSDWGTNSDTNSTAYVVQAILAAGQDPLSEYWSKNNITPIDYILSMQQDDGSFKYQTNVDLLLSATQQAIPALLEKYHPYLISSLDDCDTCFLPQIIR